MLRLIRRFGVVLAIILTVAAAPSLCQAEDLPLSPENIDAAIEAGRAYLLSLQNTEKDDPNYGSWVEPGWSSDEKDTDAGTDESASAGSPLWARYNVGNTALITYALLESGMTVNDERIRAALDWLVASQKAAATKRAEYMKVLDRLLKMDGQIGLRSDDYQRLLALEREAFECTYNVAFRVLAFRSAVWRMHRPEYREALDRDVRHLMNGLNGGAYGYVCMGETLLGKKLSKRRTSVDDLRRLPEMFVDQSNSQYGVLGVWMGTRSDIEMPRQYWALVEDYWRGVQNEDGGWGYTAPPRRAIRQDSYPAMTAAGIATLAITHNQLHAKEFVGVGRNAVDPHLDRALAWFETHFPRTMDPKARFGDSGSPAYGLNYYYLYGVERIGLACGYRTFGGVDWYRAGAEHILGQQYRSGKWKGSWTGDWVDGWRPGATAYAMLFLIRGKEPVLFARLQHDGDWNNRPHAVANLAEYAGMNLCEGPAHWQIVRAASHPDTWHDAPVLVITGSKDPKFTPGQLDKLRTYVQQGGTVLSVAEGGSGAFTAAITSACETIFPDHPLVEVTADDPIYTIFRKLKQQPPSRQVSNGLRPLWVHVDEDIARFWQLDQTTTRQGHFDFGVNLVLLADGALSRHRSLQDWPAACDVDGKAVRIATVLWDGQANPEPLALQRFAREAARRDRLNIQAIGGVDAAKLQAGDVNLAVLTGTGEVKLSEAQLAAMKAFLEAGGTLLVFPATRDETFVRSTGRAFGELLGEARRLAVDDPIYAAKGRAIEQFDLMPQTKRRLVDRLPWLDAIDIDGRHAVLLSEQSLTAGLLGWDGKLAEGYAPSTAYALMRNIVMATCQATPGQPATPPPATRARQAPAASKIIPWDQADEHVGKTVTLEGRVVDVRDVRGRMVLLDFAADPAGKLTVVIEAKHFGAFTTPPAKAYKGKLIRVTGEVASYDDTPEVQVTSPEQIKVVEQ